MQAQARTTGVRISTRKVRLVADAIRNMSVAKALQLLETTQKRGSGVLVKVLKSAVANAVQKGADEAALIIVRIEVDGGPTLRRMHIGSRSHVRMYTKRSSHIRIVVDDMKSTKGTSISTVVKSDKKAKKPVKEEKKEETK